MGYVDYLAQLMSGILPQPKAKSDVPMLLARPENAVNAPVAPAAPTVPVQPTVLGRMMSGANDMAGGIGRAMSPDVIRALAQIGKLGTDIGGRGLPANDIAALASNMAQGPLVNKQLGATPTSSAPAPAAPATSTASSGQGQPKPGDLDGNGIPDMLQVTFKGTGPTAVKQLANAGLFGGASNPQSGAEYNVGTSAPVSNIVPTSGQNLNADYDNNAMWLSGLSGNPGFVADLTKAKMAHDINSQNAATSAIEAFIKNQKLPYDQRHLDAQTDNLKAQTAGTGPYGASFKGDVTAAEEKAKLAYKQKELSEFVTSPSGQVLIPTALRRALPIPANVRTFGDYATLAGDRQAVNHLMDKFTSMSNAQTTAAGLTNSERLKTLVQLKDIQMGEISTANAMVLKLTDPRYTLLLKPEEKAAIQADVEYWRRKGLDASNRLKNTEAALGGTSNSTAGADRVEKVRGSDTKVYKTKADVQADVYKGILKDGDIYTIDGKPYQVKLRSK
jgi:hypothetical protein